MGSSWGDQPKWRAEGRTGPGPAAPKYKKASDRATVRKGGTVGQWKGDSNPGRTRSGNRNPGGSTRKITPNKGGGGGSKKGCAVTALALAGGIVGIVSAAGYGVIEAVKAVL